MPEPTRRRISVDAGDDDRRAGGAGYISEWTVPHCEDPQPSPILQLRSGARSRSQSMSWIPASHIYVLAVVENLQFSSTQGAASAPESCRSTGKKSQWGYGAGSACSMSPCRDREEDLTPLNRSECMPWCPLLLFVLMPQERAAGRQRHFVQYQVRLG
jgi:hypothetical protein